MWERDREQREKVRSREPLLQAFSFVVRAKALTTNFFVRSEGFSPLTFSGKLVRSEGFSPY